MIQEIWALVNEMSPYLLLGFGFAGLLHAFVPTAMYRRYLGGNDFRSVLWAALIGVPLPLCSCGVIPTAMSLRKEGASKGATTSFLIATPQTGVDSILATGSLLGLPFAILRPVAALVTALLGGVAVNRWGGEHDAAQAQPTPADGEDLPTADGAACCVIMASQGYPGKYQKGFEITVDDSVKDSVIYAGAAWKDGRLVTNGGRVLGVLGMGKDLREAIARAYENTEKVTFANAYCRKDIGSKAL